MINHALDSVGMWGATCIGDMGASIAHLRAYQTHLIPIYSSPEHLIRVYITYTSSHQITHIQPFTTTTTTMYQAMRHATCIGGMGASFECPRA